MEERMRGTTQTTTTKAGVDYSYYRVDLCYDFLELINLSNVVSEPLAQAFLLHLSLICVCENSRSGVWQPGFDDVVQVS